jgi:hypothetical protein
MNRVEPIMRTRPLCLALSLLVLASPSLLRAEGVPVEEAARFLLILASAAHSDGRIACKEMDMAVQLKKRDISVDARANVAWAFTPEQTRFYAGQNKLVVCSSRKFIPEGAAIAFERTNGRLTIFYNPANLEKCGVQLPDTFLRGAVKI